MELSRVTSKDRGRFVELPEALRMRSLLSRYALSSCAAAAMLTGCGGSQLPVRAPGATPQGHEMAAHANSTNYRIVYSFLGSPDGGSPTARLIDVGGTLYGTTSQGGSYKYGACGTSNFFGCGTVFSVTTGGTEKVLHNFRSKTTAACRSPD
jgi:uncharacterized repeat protein (TIGR03803 family)